jgi:parallel beta-helix repeat protein
MNILRGRIPHKAVPFTVVMVSILLACFAFLTVSQVSAAPTTMNFQGRLADASGNTVADGTYNMQFRLFTVSSGGSATWTETRETTNRVTVTNGLFSVQLGSVTPLSASLFSGNDVYFEITLPTPGTATCGTASCASWESAMTPRHKMATSAYAFQAENANTLDGLDSTAFAAATGSANYIQNTTTPQTADFAITGTGRVDTVLQAPSIQRNAAGTLSIGTTATTTGLTLGSTSLTGTLSIDSGAASTITIGASASARTINIGNVAAVQTVTLGSTNTTSATTIQGGATGSISLATGGTINLNSGTIATNATTANFLNTTATTVNAFGAATSITMGANSGTASIRNSNVTVGNVTTRGTFTNNGATLNSTLALGDLAAGAIGTAATTVDIYTGVTISPTVAGRTYTVPSPTVTTAGRTFYISNINGSNNFIVLGQTIAPSTTVTLVWGGVAWAISATPGANTSLSNLASTNINAALNTTSGNLTLQTTTSGNIILNPVGSIELQKATNVTGNLGVTGNINLSGATPAIAATTAATNFTINAGTTGQVQIGGVSTGDILFGGGSGSTGCTVTNSSGAFACTSTINGATLSGGSLSGGTITGGTLSATAVNSLNVSGTAITGTGALGIASGGANTNITLNGTGTGQVQVGGTSTGDILLGGGSGSTGCTVTNSSGTFACSSTITGTQLVSNVATGTAPLTVASTTLVTNLNADLLDGQQGSYYQNATNLTTGTLDSARISGSYTGISGVGTITVGTWQGTAIAVANGGTGATTSQGAINAISQLTTNGDILYYNGTNSTRLARGTTGQCLTSTVTTLQWGSCDYGANATLSNLGAVAINTSLISDTTNTDDLGSSAITWRSGYFGTAIYSPLLDRANAGTLTIGGTNATSISLADDTVVAAGKSLTVVGGNTASRPGSPTEGMVYFDSETDKLLTYSNGKWQADRTDAVLVAASNSSQSDKDAADYVADGNTGAALDGDQVQINSALTAASGKKVVLLAGTYTVDATISVPNNTILTGVGNGTLITIPNSFNAAIDTITNTDTSTGTGVTIRDLKIDGNKANQASGVMRGISLTGMGAGSGGSARLGGSIIGVTLDNQYGNPGVLLTNSHNSVVTDTKVRFGVSTGIYLDSSNNNRITNNLSQGNAGAGIVLDASSNNTVSGNISDGSTGGNGISVLASSIKNAVSGNTITGNSNNGISVAGNDNTFSGNNIYNNTGTGIFFSSVTGGSIVSNVITASGSRGINLTSSSNVVVSSNNVSGSTSSGIYLSGSTTVTVNANRVHDNSGAANNNGIYLTTTDGVSIYDNMITDTACGAGNTCSAININDAASDNTYLSGNTFTGDGTDAAIINDAGTGTIYAGQAKTQGGLDMLYKQAASTSAFQIQNATGGAAFNVDTTNSIVSIGPATQQIELQGGAGDHSIEIGRTDGTASNPYIDLHSATTASDYDVRLVSIGGSGTAGAGQLEILAERIDVEGQIELDFTSAATVNGVCHSGADIDTTGTGRLLVACSAAPNDYAEFYPTEEDVAAGELVATTPNLLTYEAQGADAETGIIESMGTKQISILKKAEAGDSIIGIVSTAPYQTIGKDIPESAHRLPIAMSGRVPLKVTDENGSIAAGDKLTISTTQAGYAAKAVTAGNTYAVALEPMDDATGTIMVYVENNYYAPSIQNAVNMNGSAVLASLDVAGNINVMGDASLVNLTVAQNLTVQGELLVAGKATVGDLYLTGHSMSKGATPTFDKGQALGAGASAAATIDGTDTAGTINVTAGSTDLANGVLGTVTFAKAYEGDHKTIVSARNEHAAQIRVYIVKTDTGFEVRSLDALSPDTTYSFDYIVQGIAP